MDDEVTSGKTNPQERERKITRCLNGEKEKKGVQTATFAVNKITQEHIECSREVKLTKMQKKRRINSECRINIEGRV